MGKFVLRKTETGRTFHLTADNGETIATSEAYKSRASLKQGIQSVKNNAPVAKVEDQTVAGFATVTNPKFVIYTDKAGETRFRLKARNGQIIASSEGYKKKEHCEKGVESVRKNAPDAELVEAE